MQFDAVYTVRKEFEKEAFLRRVLMRITAAGKSPVDAVDAEFGEVKESVREVIVCAAHVSGRCTASIGYDRQEAYTDYEQYKEKVGDTYVTRTRPVTKYRTVTDWQPYATDFSGKATCAAYNFEDYSFDTDDIVHALKTTKVENIVEEGDAVVDSHGLRHVLMMCEARVQVNAVKFPGDRHRDDHYDCDSTVEDISCYKMPFYNVTYTYDGRKYNAYGFACGEISVEAEIPTAAEDTTSIVLAETKSYEKAQKNAWRLFTLAMIVAAVLCVALKFPWLFPIPILLLLCAKKASDTYAKKYQECSDRYSKDIGEAKVEALQAALHKHKLAPLSGDISAMKENCSAPPAKELKSIKGRVVGSWVLAIILTIVSLFTAKTVVTNYTHSADRVKMQVTDMRVEYDPDASPYINGCYYIHLDYQIKSKMQDVDYMDVKVYVKDKSGNELGWINSSLSDMNIKKGEKKVITTTLSENQPEKNAFFSDLYQSDLKDLKFEFEIQSIRFGDGKYYSIDSKNVY